jgi:hypothetical protein
LLDGIAEEPCYDPIMLVLTLLLAALQSQNPEYDAWASCKAGSWTRLLMTAESDGVTVSLEFTNTLLELTPQKAVIERKTKEKGEKTSITKEDIPSDRNPHPVKVEAEGNEEVDCSGKSLKCKWIQGSQGEKIPKTKIWMNQDVPGGIVKVELVTSEGTRMKMIASKWEKNNLLDSRTVLLSRVS